MFTLCNELRNQGHTVHIGAFAKRGLREVAHEKGFESREVTVRAKVDPLAVFALARLIRQEQYDIVHSHLSTSAVIGGLAARGAGVPSVATVHGLSGKWSFVTNHHMIAVSSEVRRHLISQGVAPERITVVMNGVETSALPTPAEKLEARTTLGLKEDDRVVGTTIRLVRAKGGHHGISAFSSVARKIPGSKFVIFGDGPERGALEAQAQSLGIADQVVFAGYRADVRQLLPALDAFVFPSLKEAMGLAVVEAMLAALPVVVHEIGGLPEVVKPGTGYLVAAGDEQKMALHIADLLSEPERAQSMGRAAYDWANSEFSAEAMASRTIDTYQQLLTLRR